MSNPSPSPDDRRVPASVLRLILSGIRDVAGSQFGNVLNQASLGRYVQALPPDDGTLTISHRELSRLYATTHRVVGETLTRVFLNDYGRRFPEALLAGEMGQAMRARMAGVPDAERLGMAVRLVSESGAKFSVDVELSETSEAYFLTVRECTICAEIKNARAPVCANSEAFYGAMVRGLSGKRVTAIETECVAMGDPHCRYRIRK